MIMKENQAIHNGKGEFIMEIKVIEKNLRKYLEEKWADLSFEYIVKDNTLVATCDVILTDGKGGIDVQIFFAYGKQGLFICNLIFDEMEETYENLKTVNILNRINTSGFRAYINERGHLQWDNHAHFYDECEVDIIAAAMFKNMLTELKMKDIIPAE